MLIAADNALNSAAVAGNMVSKKVENKFEEALHLLAGFEKDFPSKDTTSDQSIGDMVSEPGEEKVNDRSKYVPTTLYSLKMNIQAEVIQVKSHSVLLPLDVDESQPRGNHGWPEPTRVVEFHLIGFPLNTYPIIVERGCWAIDLPPCI